jgi:hypothetical protein
VNDRGVEVAAVRHGLLGVGEERQGVLLPFAELDGEVSRHYNPVCGGSVDEDSCVPYLMVVRINSEPIKGGVQKPLSEQV